MARLIGSHLRLYRIEICNLVEILNEKEIFSIKTKLNKFHKKKKKWFEQINNILN